MKNKERVEGNRQITVSSEVILPAAPYPRHYIHGSVTDLRDAVNAIYGLCALGYASSDIHVFASWDFLQAYTIQQRKQSTLHKAIARLTSLLDDGLGDVYLQEARQGRHILAVRLANEQQIEEVSDLLLFHRVRQLKYVGLWSVLDLHLSLAQAWALSVLSTSDRAPF